MARSFQKLTRRAIRALAPGQKITESGITAEKLSDNDIKFSVDVVVDGARIHRVIGKESDGTTRTQAEEYISNARAEAREGRLSLPRGRKLHLNFGKAADLYLAKLAEIDAKDYVNNEQHIRLHLKPYFGGMRLDQISTFTLQKFQRHLKEGKALSASTANRVLATYRRMNRRLVEWKTIPAPMPMVKLSKEENQRDFIISAAEEALLLGSALRDSSAYIWLFIKIGLATGLRHSEIVGANFKNFDPHKRRLRVIVKGGRWRNQPLTRGIVEILEREREMSNDPVGWIFPSKRSESGHVTTITDAFARVVKLSDMDPSVVVPHVMRHTAITRLAETGADIKTIQEFSGHRSLAMVLRYAHPQEQAINAALDRMEGGTVLEHPGAINAGSVGTIHQKVTTEDN
jgi:integrase